MKAQFVHGHPLMVDHTPSGAVAAGAVVMVGAAPRIAHLDIPANQIGALAAGGGVYRVEKNNNLVINDGDLVYWDVADQNVNKTSADNFLLGRAVESVVLAATHVNVQHLA